MKGNNKKGRVGELRCTECRKVHLKVIFSSEGGLYDSVSFPKKGSMRTLRITRTRVYETIRAQTRNRQAFQLVASSAASIPRTPSASNYVEMTPAEQQDIRFLYNLCLPWNLKAKIVNVLKSMSRVYISDPSLSLCFVMFRIQASKF